MLNKSVMITLCLYLIGVVVAAQANAVVSEESALKPAEDMQLLVQGNAVDPESGADLYIEAHYETADQQLRQVLYKQGEETVVIKLVDYSPGLPTPNFEQKDLRTGALITSAWEEDEIRLAYQKTADSKLAEGTVGQKSLMVIDAGFDHFVRAQWEDLLEGEKKTFSYAAPTRQQWVEMSIRQKSTCKDLQSAEAQTCFVIKPTSWVIQLFFKPIELVYETETQRLLVFRGLSNINDNEGRAQQVKITYAYPE